MPQVPDRTLHGTNDFLCHGRRMPCIVKRIHNDGKFVTAQTRHDIILTQTVLQPPGNRFQHGISRRMAHAVIDLLEPVQIDEQDGKLGVRTAHLPDGLLQAIQKQQTVRQAGECIVVGKPFQRELLFFKLAPCRYVTGHITRDFNNAAHLAVLTPQR